MPGGKRWTGSEDVRRLLKQREVAGLFTHASPFSVLVAAMGDYWRSGCREAAEAMCQRTYEAGMEVLLYEQPDLCYDPFDAIGAMRNAAYQKAITEGWEYILYLDNDVVMPQEMLLNLMQRQVPVITPIVVYADGQDHGLSIPNMEQGKGLAMIASSVLSCALFKSVVFMPWALGGFWEDALGADEAYHFTKLYRATGHRPFIDTDIVVTCQAPPHFPLDDRVPARMKQHVARFGSVGGEHQDGVGSAGSRLWVPKA